MIQHQKRLQIISFLGLLLATAVLIFLLVRPFFNILATGLILAVLFRPLYWRLYQWFGKKSAGAAGVTVLIVLLATVLPLLFLGNVLVSELLGLYQRYAHGGLSLDQGRLLASLPDSVRDFATTFTQDLNSMAATLSENAFRTFSGLVSNLASFVLSYFLTLFITYYLLKDGHRIKQALMDISPIADSQEKVLADKVIASVNGVVKGSFLLAVIQGLVATIGFSIFGVPSPLLWGAFTVVAALVPTVGTSLSLVPAVLYLFVTGNVGGAIGLAVWGALAVGLVDNFLGPKIIGKATRVHPILILMSVLGGIGLFGVVGFLLGPILMAVFVAMIDMYRTDFKKFIEK